MPTDATVTEDTVVTLLRAVVALTLVPPPMEAAPPPEVPSPTQPAPVLQCSPSGRRGRMMHTPTFNSLLDGGRQQQEVDAETVDMAVDISAAAAASRARAGLHLAGQIEHETHAEGLDGAFGNDEPDSADPAGAAVLSQARQTEGRAQARQAAQDAATAFDASAHQVLPSLHVAAQQEAMALWTAPVRRSKRGTR